MVTENSIIAVQIFDQKKFKKKDQGFLGVINIRVGDVLELGLGGEGEFWEKIMGLSSSLILFHRDVDSGSQEIQ